MQSLLTSTNEAMIIQKAYRNNLILEEWIGDTLNAVDRYDLRIPERVQQCAIKKQEYIEKYGNSTAKQLGSKGGKETAKKGKEYMAELGRKGAAKRWAKNK